MPPSAQRVEPRLEVLDEVPRREPPEVVQRGPAPDDPQPHGKTALAACREAIATWKKCS